MRGINKVILLGRLGKDPETQYLENGTPLSRFTLATNERYKDKTGNWVDQTEWHNIVVWRGLAEIAEKFLKKGSMVYLEGKLRTRSWDDKESGVKKFSTEIVGDNFIMLDRKDEANNDGINPSQTNTGSRTSGNGGGNAAAEETTDDLPF